MRRSKQLLRSCFKTLTALASSPKHSRFSFWWRPWDLSSRPLLIAGLPGMDKTTCLLNICQQMMATGIRPIVFSYHQDIDEKLEHLADSVRFVDFDGLGFNPLEVGRRKTWRAHLDTDFSPCASRVAVYGKASVRPSSAFTRRKMTTSSGRLRKNPPLWSRYRHPHK